MIFLCVICSNICHCLVCGHFYPLSMWPGDKINGIAKVRCAMALRSPLRGRKLFNNLGALICDHRDNIVRLLQKLVTDYIVYCQGIWCKLIISGQGKIFAYQFLSRSMQCVVDELFV